MKKTVPYIRILIASYTILGLVSIAFLPVNWYAVAAFFLFFALGNGTVAHRYFAHSSFKVGPKMHWVLAFWATLTGYATPAYWMSQHRHHHRFEDKPADAHSPRNGFISAFHFWVYDDAILDKVFEDRTANVNFAQAMRDPAVSFVTTYFVPINICVGLAIYLLSPVVFLSMTAAYLLEQVRLGLINTITHMDRVPFNYVNHTDKGTSKNNYVFGLLSLGFGWHNNHHANPKKLILTERWWEVDVEGYVGWLLGRCK